jgi:hypothetical protein
MSQKFKVHVDLDREELSSLEEFTREPGRTIDECWEWLQAKGYTLSRTAVANWKKSFDLEDKFKAANALAQDLMSSVAQEKGTVAISDAAMVKLSQMLFEQMLRLQGNEEVSTKELFGLSMAVKNVVQGKRHVEKLKEEMKEAIAAAEKEVSGGASGERVVEVIKKAFGIAA